MTICLVDTSIFLNSLGIPGKRQDREEVDEKFKEYVQLDVAFVLPWATILETGNIIGHLDHGEGMGRARYEAAVRFVEEIKNAVKSVDGLSPGDSPFRIGYFPKVEEFIVGLNDFPNGAKQSGMGLGDYSIEQEYFRLCRKFGGQKVFIWSLDGPLKNYGLSDQDYSDLKEKKKRKRG